MPRGPIRVGLVAQHELVRQGLRSMLTTFPTRTEVVGESLTADDLTECDVVICELDSLAPGRRLLATLGELGIPAVGVSLDPGGRIAVRARKAPHVAAVVALDMSAHDLLAALETAVDHPTDRAIADASTGGFDGKPWGLTGREVDVLALICRGFSNAELAQQLSLSENSVKGYVRLAYRKVGVSRRSQAVLWGLEHGLDTATTPRS